MRKKDQHPSPARRQKSVFGSIRAAFSFLFAVCIVAVIAGSLLPHNLFRASAQWQPGDNKSIGQPVLNGEGTEQISKQAQAQIAALIQEKTSRSPGRRKMDSRLIYSIKMERGERIAVGVDTLEITLPRNEKGQPIIDITAKVDKSFLTRLQSVGAKVISSFPGYNSVRVEVELEALDTIADFPEVIYLQPMQEAMTSQSVKDETPEFDPEKLKLTRPGFEAGFEERKNNISRRLLKVFGETETNLYTVGISGVRKSEADATQSALLSRNNNGFNGEGIKIGIISDGVRNLAAAQGSGDLGPVTVLPGQSGTSAGQCSATASCDEGTAMLELVHDLAPGAQLYFATGFGTSANFAQNIRDLRTAGCDIIVDDLFYFSESPFQDGQAAGIVSTTNGGIVAQAVIDVTANGALYFSSAGNSGNKNDNTSGVWEGDFVDGGDAAAPIGAANGRVHQFPLDGATPAQPYNVVVTAGSSQYNLNWSDPLGGSGNDYDLYALNAAGTTVVTSSTSTQDGNDDPFEAIAVTAAGTRLVIVKFSGAARFLRLTTNRGRLTVNTPGQTSGHSTVLNAFGVAATPVSAAFPNQHTSANVVETFSSDGPRKLFYQANGTPFTAGNVSSTGGISRQKPDITAADGASVTGAGGFGITFFGTSAAAPHAGAIAALLKSANPALTPAQVRTTLQNTAIDIETGGIDRDAGYGIIMANAALNTLGLPAAANLTLGAPTVDEVAAGSNGNTYLELGESGTLTAPLSNTGTTAATGVTATLSSTTTGVQISSPTRSYSDIAAANGTSSPAAPFTFLLNGTFTYAADIDFVLTVSYNGGIVRSFPFKVPTGQLAIISTTLDTTAPASGSNYTAATGTQTGRLNFSFPVSGCGTAKTNPATTSTLARRYDSYTFTNTSASTICARVLLTHSANALIHAVAYTAFTPATPSTGYAGDGGGSTTNGAGTTQLFSVSVAAGQTLVVVVSESNQNGGLGVPYSLRVTGLPPAAVPTAAPVSVGGRVSTAAGRGIAGARVTVTGSTGERQTVQTNSFGYYRFSSLPTGQTYIFSVESKNYRFSNQTQVISLQEERSDVNFVADN